MDGAMQALMNADLPRPGAARAPRLDPRPRRFGLGGLAKLLLGTTPSEDRDELTDPSTVELTQGLPGDLVDLALGKPPVLLFKLLLQAREGVLDRFLPRIPAWTHVNSASRFSVPGFGLGAAEGHRVDSQRGVQSEVIVHPRSQAKPAIPRPQLNRGMR